MTEAPIDSAPVEGSNEGGLRLVERISSLGSSGVGFVVWLGRALCLVVGAIGAYFLGKRRLPKLIRAVYELGARCVPIVAIVGLFTGLVLGLHGYYTLVRFGSQALLGPAVSLSLVRELGPVLAALMVIGQAGSALSGELGMQRKAEQIDAISLMGIRPSGFLIGPKLLAAVVTFPILTALFDLLGIFGGYLSGVVLMHVDSGIYWNGVLEAVAPADVWQGFLKAGVFGVLSITTTSLFGFFTHELADARGTQGVNETTTRAVVWSSVMVLISDYLITSFFV